MIPLENTPSDNTHLSIISPIHLESRLWRFMPVQRNIQFPSDDLCFSSFPPASVFLLCPSFIQRPLKETDEFFRIPQASNQIYKDLFCCAQELCVPAVGINASGTGSHWGEFWTKGNTY
jgi:hypothetical protein